MRMLKAKVHSKVQGVWLRKYTFDCANRLGIVGLIKNLEDGIVLLYAKGTNLEQFKKYPQSGHHNSHVNKKDFLWYTSKIEFSDFRIEYR